MARFNFSFIKDNRFSRRVMLKRDRNIAFSLIGITIMLTIFSLINGNKLHQANQQRGCLIEGLVANEAIANTNQNNLNQIRGNYEKFINKDLLIKDVPQLEDSSPIVIDYPDKRYRNDLIILDGLPTEHRQPELDFYMTRLLNRLGFGDSLADISATTQDTLNDGANPVSRPVSITIDLNIESNKSGVRKLLSGLYWSLRPMQITRFAVEHKPNQDVEVNLEIITYYQPKTTISVTNETIDPKSCEKVEEAQSEPDPTDTNQQEEETPTPAGDTPADPNQTSRLHKMY